eukprot:4529858-Pleurochrysis_carterae.AAC.2
MLKHGVEPADADEGVDVDSAAEAAQVALERGRPARRRGITPPAEHSCPSALSASAAAPSLPLLPWPLATDPTPPPRAHEPVAPISPGGSPPPL